MKIKSVLRDMISDKINLDYYENQKQNRAGVQTKTIQSIWNGTERYWARKQDSETPWLRFSQNPYSHTRRFSNFPSKSGHSSLWKQTWRFFFSTPTQPHSHLPQILPDVDTVVHTHPKVSFRLKTHYNPMIRLDPGLTSPKRQQSYTSIWNQRNHPRMSPIATPGLFLHTNVFWIFGFWMFGCLWGLGVTHPQGWGSLTST